ncbi:galactose oxidase-like domain-containing protein [Variovorax sp. LT1P1]|uniref:galactose oxidase-like domain-containing protein n=1 Tax=Variovorax sp. LT1P1 TaxID=3443730 RepID=UPI003F487898
MNAWIDRNAAAVGVWTRTGMFVGAVAMLASCGGGGGGAAGDGGLSVSAGAGTAGMTPEVAAVVAAEQDTPGAPVDPGTSPSAPVPPTTTFPGQPPEPPQPVPALTPELREAGTKGLWSAPETWPINAIHAVLTPDGKVMTYGTSPSGVQGAPLYYDVWNPVTKAHALLQQTTGTDLFCNAQLVLPVSGQVLLAGGDTRGQNAGKANTGVTDVNLFDPVAQSLKASGTPMNYARWYDTLTTLPDGRVFVLAGIDASGVLTAYPEVYTAGQGWRTLTGIRWQGEPFYPRVMLAPTGQLVAASGTTLYGINTDGNGSLAQVGALPSSVMWYLPWAMFDKGKALFARVDGKVSVVDVNTPTPVVTETEGLGGNRVWASTTVLPDGQVLATGGAGLAIASSITAGPDGQIVAPGAAGQAISFEASLWNPKTGRWSVGASAQKYRLYHSTALLLPDATVLTVGGGSPGPVVQLNGEVYSPPYLFAKDGSGRRLPRPMIVAAQGDLTLGQDFSMSAMSSRPIQRVTLVRTGSVTHSTDFEQRFLELPFTQDGTRLTMQLNENANVVPPGHYMVFAFDDAGVPSIAKIVRIGSTAVPAQFTLAAHLPSFLGTADVGRNGSARIDSAGVLMLTDPKVGQLGSAFYRAPVALNGDTSFSTRFQFKMSSGGGEGMTFVMQGNDSSTLGEGGSALGYGGIRRSVAVKLDTRATLGQDPNGNHIGILLNGSLLADAYVDGPFTLADGFAHTMWVDYDARARQLSVFLSREAAGAKPAQPVLQRDLHLASVVDSAKLYVGFTAATGQQPTAHQIDNWSFVAGAAPAAKDRLAAGEQLIPGQRLVSPDGRFGLAFEENGNLVLTEYASGTVRWQSGTAGKPSARLTMGSEGDLVLYGLDPLPIWRSGNAPAGATSAALGNDGVLALHRPDGTAVWRSSGMPPAGLVASR